VTKYATGAGARKWSRLGCWFIRHLSGMAAIARELRGGTRREAARAHDIDALTMDQAAL